MALFAGAWGRWPVAKDWVALVLGFGGIVVLNLGSELRGSPVGVGALMFGTAAWAFGIAGNPRFPALFDFTMIGILPSAHLRKAPLARLP